KLSDIASTVFAMDAISCLVAHMADDKRCDIRLEAAMAKLFCTEESWKIVNHAIQIRGGRGYETGPSLAGRGKPAFPLERALRDSRVNMILEGSSEILHLFIAREALDFHLKGMKSLLDPKVPITRKMTIALSTGIKYLFWYPQLWIPCFCGGKTASSRRLKRHMRFIRRASRRLARGVFHKMMCHQKKLVSKQNILNRFVDISLDIFAMSAACSYADSLFKKGEKKENSLDLADLFCRRAENRIKKNFSDVRHNDDKLSDSIAKKLLAAKYEWLENDIIKK
ncbi:MAG: acyl-CoA dehydrogenase family protein, partial [Candidatus Omnitrophota bacterium]